MPLATGARLASYEIVGALGAGGMGEVYRARDVNLGREVAIKILPEAFAAEPDRVARFEREARVLASLNHPNIATIHGLERANGLSFLIMELVAGETLAARITRGRVPVEDALPLATQIAAALEAAHEKGIVHRDLKPANIAVTSGGKVKVLDFGLAKALAEDGRAIDVSNSPTMAKGPSSTGLIVGTAAYMSPEQARGKPVDKRADIWAFGCVLYELLTGKAAFAGETLTDIVAAVVKNEPEWTTLPADTPAVVRALLRRCLKKDPGQRMHDASDARIETEEALTEPAARATSILSTPSRGYLARAIPWAIVALLTLSLAASWLGPNRTKLPNPTVARLEFSMPPGVEVTTTSTPTLSISPDGSRIAFIGAFNGLRQLYVRRIDEFGSTLLRGTESASTCFFSPDGSALAFITSNRVLKRVSLADGLVTTVVDDADYFTGGAWGPDDRISFGRNGSIWQVAATGGSPRRLTTLDNGKGDRLHGWPAFAAGGTAILFTVVTGSDRTATHIDALSLATAQQRTVVDQARFAIYASSDHILFFRDNALLAAPFDPDLLQPSGPAVAVLENVSLDQLGSPVAALSNAGILAYAPTENATKRLVWVSRQGVEEPITDVSRQYQNPRLAPDGHRIVTEVAGGNLWVQDAARTTFTRLTSEETLGNTYSVWAPDSRRIVFRTLTGLRWIDPEGSGGSHAIPGTSFVDLPTAISPDNETLAFIRQTPATSADVYVLSLSGEPRPRPLLATAGYDGGAQFSPDGRLMAYVSNESGQFEVYLRPYPSPDRKLPVSTQGGTHPKWNRNGKELFYRSGNKMMVVDVSLTPELTLSQPRVLFDQRYAFGSAQTIPNYDVSPDGQRFVMVKDDSASGRLNLVLNWFEELKRLAPASAK